MSKTEQAVLAAKTPEEYISLSLKAKISPSAKARLAREWMASTGYTKEDILAARNRHPYWKRKKMEGSAERTRRRLAEHDYSGGRAVAWDREKVEEFLSLNAKGPDGRYERKDRELAERFSASIPSIQYMRRKHAKVLGLLGPKAPRAKVAEYLLLAESVLNRGPEALSAKPKSAAAAKSAPKAKAVSKAVAKPEPKPKAGPKPAPKAKPASKAASGLKAAPKPVAKAKPAAKAGAKPAAAPKSKPASRALEKAPAKAAAKTATKAPGKTAASTAKASPKASAKVSPKPAKSAAGKPVATKGAKRSK